MEYEKLRNQEMPLNLEEKRLGIQDKRAKIKADQASKFMDDYIRLARGDGSMEDNALSASLAQQYGVPENHPIISGLRQAYMTGGTAGAEKFKNYVASGGQKEREQRVREDAIATRQSDLLASRERINERTLESRERIERARLAERAAARAKAGDGAIRIKNWTTGIMHYRAAYEEALQSGDKVVIERVGRLLNDAIQGYNTEMAAEQAKRIPMKVDGVDMRPAPQLPYPTGPYKQPQQAADPLNLFPKAPN